jgi:hypothetical protein
MVVIKVFKFGILIGVMMRVVLRKLMKMLIGVMRMLRSRIQMKL